MRGISPVLHKFIKVPSAAAYSDDYPRAKIYVACLEDTTNIDLNAQEVPVTGLDSGKVSFTKLNFPDNFFDIVVSGYLILISQLINRSMHLAIPEFEWPAVIAECHRVLKPGYPHCFTI